MWGGQGYGTRYGGPAPLGSLLGAALEPVMTHSILTTDAPVGLFGTRFYEGFSSTFLVWILQLPVVDAVYLVESGGIG